jgi:hypothetical protein
MVGDLNPQNVAILFHVCNITTHKILTLTPNLSSFLPPPAHSPTPNSQKLYYEEGGSSAIDAANALTCGMEKDWQCSCVKSSDTLGGEQNCPLWNNSNINAIAKR